MKKIIHVRINIKSESDDSMNSANDFHQTILDYIGKEALQMYSFS